MSHTHEANSPAQSRALTGYLIGFGYSLILTALPFAIVMLHLATIGQSVGIIAGCALLQIMVHLHYFLHIDLSDHQRWNLMSFLFTVLIVVILVGGSVWIMTSIGHHMMLPV